MGTPVGPLAPNSSNPYGINANNQGLGNNILNQYVQGFGGVGSTSSLPSSLTAGNMVYMGRKKAETKMGPGPYAPGYKTPFAASDRDELSFDEARLLPLKWAREDPKKLKDFVNKGILYKVPGFSTDMGIMEIASAWEDMVKASQEFSKGGSDWSPYDVMETYKDAAGKFGTERKGDWIYDVATGKPVKYVGPTSKTTTSKNVNLSSAEDVQALTMQMLRELLGRNPTDQEVAQFKSSINTLQAANPEITTTTSQLKPNLATGEVETVSQSSVTSGGVSQGAMQAQVEEETMKSPEYAKYQGGTTYFNALLQLIGGGI